MGQEESEMIPIISGLIAAVNKWQEGRTKIKEAKISAKVAKYDAQAQRYYKLLDAETNWDLEALRQSQYSLKDELITVIIFSPLVVAWFDPARAKAWLDFVVNVPLWYQIVMGGIIAAAFGLRWYFTKKKL